MAQYLRQAENKRDRYAEPRWINWDNAHEFEFERLDELIAECRKRTERRQFAPRVRTPYDSSR